MGTVYLDRKASARVVGNVKEDDLRCVAEECCRAACRVGGKITVVVEDDGKAIVYASGTIDEQTVWMTPDQVVGVFDVPAGSRKKTNLMHAEIILEALCAHVESVA